jgi:hypothetical protein
MENMEYKYKIIGCTWKVFRMSVKSSLELVMYSFIYIPTLNKSHPILIQIESYTIQMENYNTNGKLYNTNRKQYYTIGKDQNIATSDMPCRIHGID